MHICLRSNGQWQIVHDDGQRKRQGSHTALVRESIRKYKRQLEWECLFQGRSILHGNLQWKSPRSSRSYRVTYFYCCWCFILYQCYPDCFFFHRSKQNLKVREHQLLGTYVDGLSQLAVTSYKVSYVFDKFVWISHPEFFFSINSTFELNILLKLSWWSFEFLSGIIWTVDFKSL